MQVMVVHKIKRFAGGRCRLHVSCACHHACALWVPLPALTSLSSPMHAAVWATEENTLPACGPGKNFTYKHWDETLPDSVALAPGPNGTEPGTGINGHVTSTSTWSDVSDRASKACRSHAACLAASHAAASAMPLLCKRTR